MQAPPTPPAERPYRGLGRLALAFVVVNLLIFLAHRLLFLATYVEGATAVQRLWIVLYGVRLDLGLLGAELALLVFLSLLRLRIGLRPAVAYCIAATGLNTTLCVADYLFYGQRDEHLGRLLLANLASPHVLGEELSRFVRVQPLAAGACLLALALFVALAVWLVRRAPRRTWSHVRPKRRLLYAGLLGSIFMLPMYRPARVVGGDRIIEGWSVEVTSPEHFQVFDDYALHQALFNPMQDLVFARLPHLLASPPPPRIPSAEVGDRLGRMIPGELIDPRYPLLRRIQGRGGLGLENVLVLQVEGLSGSLVGKDEDGRPVMPFLRDLVSRSLYFPNALHGYATTYGGLHSLTASIPRTATKVIGGRFTYDELQGFFGSAPRLLPELATHAYIHGSVQTAEDLRTYMGNQGFTTTDWRALVETLAPAYADEDLRGELGVWDGPFLQEVARVLRTAPRPAWIHALTTTTHSPWKVPDATEPAFEDPVLAGFRYVDDELRAMFAALEADPELMARTLVVLTADHVSFGYGQNELDWVRIPLVFYNPTFVERGLAGRNERWATHTDALRTVLGLLGGTHTYAGLGRDLLADDEPFGTLGSTKDAAYYVRDGYVVRWSYVSDAVTLHAASPAAWETADRSAEDPERLERLSREMFTLFEGVRTLVQEGRVYPRSRNTEPGS